MTKKLLLTIFVLTTTIYFANAQSWQWGARGGSSDTYGSGPDETVIDMATDVNGNVYVLSKVLQTGLNVDGNPVTAWGAQDILISSFRCDGTYRWSEDLGSYTEDVPVAIKTDTMGGVYITGYLGQFDVTDHVGADTSWYNSTNQLVFVAKFDTSGIYKWLRMPQPDTVGFAGAEVTRPLDMDVDGAGNIYLMCALSPGAYAGGSYVVASTGVYILKYDYLGDFTGGTQMQIGYTATAVGGISMKRDYGSGRYYITGSLGSGVTGLSFAGTPITQALFIGCFNDAGALLWQRQNTSTYTYTGFARAAVDPQHNIYISGISNYFTVNDTFNSYVVVNTLQSFGQVPLVVKLDTNGSNIWAANGSANAATYTSSIALNGNEVDISGQYPGELKWAGYPDSLNLPESSGYHIYVTRFNATTGAVIGLDSLASTTGDNNDATAMTSDRIGNFYVGGDFASQITVNGTTLSSIGGGSDFFIAKYGSANCSCTSLPVANFTASTGGPHVSFTYTGTTTSEDSVRWIFGDGGTSTTVSPTHTYTATGTYTACVTVYTSCGSDSVCQSVHIVVSGVSTLAFPDVSIYPNPATEQLVIENATAGTTVVLFSIMGQQVYSGTVGNSSQAIDMHNLPAGNYIIQLTDANGNRMNKTVVKE